MHETLDMLALKPTVPCVVLFLLGGSLKLDIWSSVGDGALCKSEDRLFKWS